MSRKMEYLERLDMYPSDDKIYYEVDSNTVNYIVPVCPNSTYTVTMDEIGNRLRAGFTTTELMSLTEDTDYVNIVMNPTFDVGYTFSYTATQYGYMIVYVSNAGEHPNISITTDGVGGDDESSVFTNCVETSSGTTLSAYVYARSGDWVLATVTTRSATTFSDGWNLIMESGEIIDSTQKMYFLSKQATNDGLQTINVSQSSSARIYINLITFSNILGFSYHEGNEFLENNTQIKTVTLNRPNYPIIVWGCSANFWLTSAPYGNWSCDDLNAICLDSSKTDPRQANFIDKGTPTQRIFSASTETYCVIDCIEVVKYSRRYLIRENNVLYTISDNVLTEINESEINANLFKAYGFDIEPTWDILSTLVNPEILMWYDSEKNTPKISVQMTATPQNQIVISNSVNLVHESIKGIESATATCTGTLSMAISTDDKVTWKAHNGTEWLTLSDDYSGMSKEQLEAITVDQWNEIITEDVDTIYIRIALTDTTQSVEEIVINFAN